MKDKYWIVIGFLFCIFMGYVVAFGLQYSYHIYYGSMVEWDKILYGGLILGILFFGPMATLILFEIINLKTEVKTSGD